MTWNTQAHMSLGKICLLLLLSCVSRVWLCATPETAAHQAPVPGILQARTLEWLALSFSSAWKWKVKVKSLSHVRLFATPWIAAYQAPPSMGFPRQEYWSGVPLPSRQLYEGRSIREMLHLPMLVGQQGILSLPLWSPLLGLHSNSQLELFFSYCRKKINTTREKGLSSLSNKSRKFLHS